MPSLHRVVGREQLPPYVLEKRSRRLVSELKFSKATISAGADRSFLHTFSVFRREVSRHAVSFI
jgi:hypothetical protein